VGKRDPKKTARGRDFEKVLKSGGRRKKKEGKRKRSKRKGVLFGAFFGESAC